MRDWGYVSGQLRSYEKELLDYQTLTRWSESDEKSTLMKNISDSVYSDVFTEDNITQYESLLEEHSQEIYGHVRKLIPDDSLIRVHNLAYDLNNIKMIFKGRMMGADVNWDILSEKGSFPPEEVFSIIEESQYFKFPGAVGKAFSAIEEEYHRSENIQIVDFMIDNVFNDYRFELLSSDPAYEAIRSYYSVWVDMENIDNILRAKRMGFDKTSLEHILLKHGTISRDSLMDFYSEGLPDLIDSFHKTAYGDSLARGLASLGEEDSFSLLEKEMDEVLLDKMAPFRYVAQGPEVVEEYLSLKAMEIKNLKILIIGILNRIQADEIKSRLRNNGI